LTEGTDLKYNCGMTPVSVQPWESGFRLVADHLRAMVDSLETPHHLRPRAPVSWTPRLNFYETADRYILCVELSGMPREEINVWASDGVLHISGDRKKPVPPDSCRDVGVHVMEIDSGCFHRRVPMPEDVRADEISATYRHGYLWIVLPRSNGPGSAE